MPDIRHEFRSWQKLHKNIMTPHIKRLYVTDDRVVELSSGTGIENEAIFGVSEFKRIGEFKFESLGGEMFHSEDRAREYAKKLKTVV